MKVVNSAQYRLRPWLAQRYGPRQSWQQLGEAKPAVEAVGGFGQIAPCVLGLPQGVVAAADGSFDVAEQDVHLARAVLNSVAVRPLVPSRTVCA